MAIKQSMDGHCNQGATAVLTWYAKQNKWGRPCAGVAFHVCMMCASFSCRHDSAQCHRDSAGPGLDRMHTSAIVAFLDVPSCWLAFLLARGAGVAAGVSGEAATADEGGIAVLVGSSAASEAESTCTRTHDISQALP